MSTVAEKEILIEQIGDDFGITVRYEMGKYKTTCIDFFAAEVTSVALGGIKCYWRKGADSSMDDTEDFNDAERYISGSVKWDGCSHFNFGDEEGYLHLCGGSDIGKLQNTLRVIYERCGALMKANGGNLLDGEFDVSEKKK